MLPDILLTRAPAIDEQSMPPDSRKGLGDITFVSTSYSTQKLSSFLNIASATDNLDESVNISSQHPYILHRDNRLGVRYFAILQILHQSGKS